MSYVWCVWCVVCLRLEGPTHHRPRLIRALLPILRKLEGFDTLVGVHLRTGYADWQFRNAAETFARDGPTTPSWSVLQHWSRIDEFLQVRQVCHKYVTRMAQVCHTYDTCTCHMYMHMSCMAQVWHMYGTSTTRVWQEHNTRMQSARQLRWGR